MVYGVSRVDAAARSVACGAAPIGIGRSSRKGCAEHDQKGPFGRKIGQEMITLVKKHGTGWYEYHVVNPQTDKIQAKIAYYKRVDNEDYYLACGMYK